VPVPRRFDRSLPERDSTRINERIRVPEVRLIGPDGDQVGILKTAEALRYAQERDLDLVEVAPDAKPPVCRVLDYSKYKYEQNQRQKAARKHQQQITIREIKFRPKIAQHDYDTKKGHVERFLKARDKVKVTIMFRGREQAHPERGEMILNRLAEELEDVAIVEQRPIQDGRNMTMMLGPLRTKESEGGGDAQQEAGQPSKKERRQQKLEQRAAPPEAKPKPKAAPAPAPEPEPEPEPELEPEEAAPAAAEAKPAPARKAAAKKPAAKKPAKAGAAAKDS
jgi:translation initiation factor IF-3